MMKNISRPQKRIILITAIVLASFFLFFFFIYYPARNTVSRIRREISGAQEQIQQIESIVSKAKTATEGISLLVQRYQKLNSMFPQKEEEILKMLSGFAPASNIEIISIRPESKTYLLDAKGQKLGVEGRECQKVFVSIEMKGCYKDLIKYLQALKESLPAFFSVEALKISKDSAAPKLDITLGINFYLLS